MIPEPPRFEMIALMSLALLATSVVILMAKLS